MEELLAELEGWLASSLIISEEDLTVFITRYLGPLEVEHNIDYLVDVGTISEIQFGNTHKFYVSGKLHITVRKHNAFFGG